MAEATLPIVRRAKRKSFRGALVQAMNGQHRGNRLIFVGGAPRSGTTLVQNILDSHPDIVGGQEFHCVPNIAGVRAQLHSLDQYCSHEEVDRLLASLIESLLLPLADRQGSKLLSEKTPGNVLVFLELLELFPEAHFIHVVRDPRDTVASLLFVGRRAVRRGKDLPDWTREVAAAAQMVRRHLRRGFQASAKCPQRVMTLLFERLVSDPEGETKRICDFLGIEWYSSLLRPASVEHIGRESIVDNVWYTDEEYVRDPEIIERGRWAQLSTIQQLRIARAFRDHDGLAHLGYRLSRVDLSLTGSLIWRSLGLVRSVRTSFRRANHR